MKNLFFDLPQENPMIDLLPEVPQCFTPNLKNPCQENRSALKKAVLARLLRQNAMLVYG